MKDAGKSDEFGAPIAQPSPTGRLIAPRIAAIAAPSLIGGLIGGETGLVLGVLIGLIYVACAGIASGHYALDLHKSEVLDRFNAPETYHVTEQIAVELGIEPPSLHSINVERAQMCVHAVGLGRHAQGRIGISRTLLQNADEVLLRHLIALAMARIWTGEATIMSAAVALAGLPLQLAQSSMMNGGPDSKLQDMECGLSPIGKCFLIVLAPISRMILSLAGASTSPMRADLAALRLGRLRFEPVELESAMRWLQDQQSPVVHDPMAEYNPAESAVYLVSPFEVDFAGRVPIDNLPLWKRARFLVTSAVPDLESRISRIHERAAQKPGSPGAKPEESPSPVYFDS
jgi:heat shock protein HtpX